MITFVLCAFGVRSASRKKNLKEAFDRMVRFHEDMINALTWLTSAESKVAELDSAVEATSTDEQQDLEALRKELKVSFRLLAEPVSNRSRSDSLLSFSPHNCAQKHLFNFLVPSLVSQVSGEFFFGREQLVRKSIYCNLLILVFVKNVLNGSLFNIKIVALSKLVRVLWCLASTFYEG